MLVLSPWTSRPQKGGKEGVRPSTMLDEAGRTIRKCNGAAMQRGSHCAS